MKIRIALSLCIVLSADFISVRAADTPAQAAARAALIQKLNQPDNSPTRSLPATNTLSQAVVEQPAKSATTATETVPEKAVTPQTDPVATTPAAAPAAVSHRLLLLARCCQSCSCCSCRCRSRSCQSCGGRSFQVAPDTVAPVFIAFVNSAPDNVVPAAETPAVEAPAAEAFRCRGSCGCGSKQDSTSSSAGNAQASPGPRRDQTSGPAAKAGPSTERHGKQCQPAEIEWTTAEAQRSRVGS